jgi:hypothetical protein
MATTITGNDHAYSTVDILDVNGDVITRVPTAEGTDDFAFAGADFITATIGATASAANNGFSVNVRVRNGTPFVISQVASGTNLTISVPDGLKVPAQGCRIFTFILTDFATSAWLITVADYYEHLVLRETSTGGTHTTTISSPAVLANDLSLVLPGSAGTAGYFLQTNGAGATSWAPDSLFAAAMIYAIGPAAAVAVTGAWATVVLSTAPVNPDAALTLSAGAVLLSGVTSAGIYEVSYWSQFQSSGTSGTARASLSCRVFVTPTGAPGSSVAGSEASAYLREQNGAVVRPGCGKTILVVLSDGDTVSLQVQRTVGSSDGDVTALQCTLVLAKLR